MMITAVVGALLLGALWLFAVAIRRLVARGPLGAAAAGLGGLCALLAAALLAALGASVRGYHPLGHEALAATLRTRPLGEQLFLAELELPDGTERAFQIEGDQLYVDARILKWKSWANHLGLHTAYRLERIGGRYVELEHERERPRSLYGLAEDRALDAFAWRRRYAWLAPLVDAEYGSATFIGAERPAVFELRVSTTGLLIRERRPAGRDSESAAALVRSR